MDKTVAYEVVLCDLDGVVWLAHEPIPGAVDAVGRLRNAGVRVMFVTNNSFSTREEQHAALGRIGIEAEGQVLTSAMSAASVIQPDWRVLVCGGRGLQQEVGAACAEMVVAHDEPVPSGSFDAVVVGMHREFDYRVLSRALTAVDRGATLIGSNADPTYPTPEGPSPGGGSILAAIAAASGAVPVVTGKPHAPMARLVLQENPGVAPNRMLMVGDRADTDGLFAATMGCDFALVLSGVTKTSAGVESRHCGGTLADIADVILGLR